VTGAVKNVLDAADMPTVEFMWFSYNETVRVKRARTTLTTTM